MSRGAGRLERAIRDLLEASPRGTFTGDELVDVCFPGLNRIEKKHKVSTLRAAAKVVPRLRWGSRRFKGAGGSLIFFNLLDLRSFSIGTTRATELGRRQAMRLPILLSDVQQQINKTSAIKGRPVFADHKSVVRYATPTEAEAAEMLVAGKRQCWVRTDGPYPLAVSAHKAEAEGQDASEQWRLYKSRVYTAVYQPDQIAGDIHPDFLAA